MKFPRTVASASAPAAPVVAMILVDGIRHMSGHIAEWIISIMSRRLGIEPGTPLQAP